MAEAGNEERTEKATGRRRQEARKKGQVAQSREIPSVLILITSLGFFYFAGSWLFSNLLALFTGIYQHIDSLRFQHSLDTEAFSIEVFKDLFGVLVPFFVPILVAAIAGNVFQIGFEMHGETMTPNLGKLNPIAGLKKFVSLRSFVELFKSVLKLLCVGGIAYLSVRPELASFPPLMQHTVGDILVFTGRTAFKICFFICLALIVLAVLDYAYQRWQYEKDLRMTKQEVRDERKLYEGDPQVKGRIRRMQLEMAQRRMMQAVPEADVVITNPTHLAIALKFDAQKMIAPTVLAKGAGLLAERIKDIAEAHQVPLVENKPLAQALYKMVEIGQLIPVELYQAVAEVLAYVYRLKGMVRRS
jgi:flagellar biosynthesis protein FlhB